MQLNNKFLIFVLFLAISNAQRTRDKMYEPINGVSACFRRLNGTHQIGCSSNREGSTGVIHFVETEGDLHFVLAVDNNLNYIPAVPIHLFNKTLTDKLQGVEHIAGLLVYDYNEDKESLSHFSHDQKCPNENSNIQGTCSKAETTDNDWNQVGTSLLFEDFRYPIFYLNDEEEIEKVKTCYHKFNNFSFDEHPRRSLCSMELLSFMFAAHDTPTCLRRSHSLVNMNPVKFCDPLGDQNVWSSLFPMGNSSLTPETKIRADIKHILVVARLDTTSMFNNLGPGAHSSVTGLVTLLNVAELLKRMLPSYENYDRNVLFIVFNGESYDYIGSSRIVYDIQHGDFPQKDFESPGDGDGLNKEEVAALKMEDIEMVFEISQLSKAIDTKSNLHLHMLNESEHLDILTILGKNLQFEKHFKQIPPTSIQSFVKASNAPPALVLTDYAKYFTNQFYNSIYDNVKNIQFTYQNMSEEVIPTDSVQYFLGNVAEGIAKSLFESVTRKEYKGDEHVNLYYVNELLHCYLENASCTIHRALRKGNLYASPMNLYVGVTISPNYISNILALTFAFFMGDKIETGPCKPVSSHVYFHFNMSDSVEHRNDTRCYRASMNLTDAESPAFLIEDYDWSSGEYSSWTESVWREFNVRLFLKPARAHEVMTITVGAIVFALSLCVILFVNAKKELLFTEITTTTPPTNC